MQPHEYSCSTRISSGCIEILKIVSRPKGPSQNSPFDPAFRRLYLPQKCARSTRAPKTQTLAAFPKGIRCCCYCCFCSCPCPFVCHSRRESAVASASARHSERSSESPYLPSPLHHTRHHSLTTRTVGSICNFLFPRVNQIQRVHWPEVISLEFHRRQITSDKPTYRY